MRIKCQCGKLLNLRDDMAGKAVKCPSCGKVLKVPKPGGASKSAAKSPAASRPVAKPAAPPAPSAMDELFSEEGFDRQVAAVCPACAAEMEAGAVLCTKCGYNKQTGERMEAHKTAGVDIDMGTLALMKAEKDMVKDVELQQKMLGKAGMPPWMLALILFVLVSATSLAALAANAANQADSESDINFLALFLALSGGAFYLVALGANIAILVHAFKQSVVQGLLCLFVPLYILYHIIKHFRELWKLFVVAVLCGMIAGGFIVGVGAAGGL